MEDQIIIDLLADALKAQAEATANLEGAREGAGAVMNTDELDALLKASQRLQGRIERLRDRVERARDRRAAAEDRRTGPTWEAE